MVADAPQTLMEGPAWLDDGGEPAGRLIRPADPPVASEPEWDAALRSRPGLEVPGCDVVVVAPHPDDETLGAGGLIAGATAWGRSVRVVVCTDGEAASDAPGLGGRRRAETLRALDLLTAGVGVEVLFVGAPDGTLASSTDAVVEAVRPLLASRPLLVAPWEHDGHPDHDAVGRACAALGMETGIDVWRYPIWAWHWADPQRFRSLSLGCLPLSEPVRWAKGRAVEAFRSQITATEGPPVLPPHVRAHFQRPYEAFVLGPEPG